MFDRISEKISQTAGIVKINGQISDEERKINDCFLQMGKICFDKFPENPEPYITELVAYVNEAKARIADYAEQVKKLKGIVKCGQCGMDVTSGNQFCSGCGTRVRAEIAVAAETGQICTGCNQHIADDAAFCTNCGQKANPQP
ncbi:MAG: zinc ribbon domain-containing protein [Firmicutes bacterium]|nr:zinc ribbon domain-containing protein [Bacillota bacterium]